MSTRPHQIQTYPVWNIGLKKCHKVSGHTIDKKYHALYFCKEKKEAWKTCSWNKKSLYNMQKDNIHVSENV